MSLQEHLSETLWKTNLLLFINEFINEFKWTFFFCSNIENILIAAQSGSVTVEMYLW